MRGCAPWRPVPEAANSDFLLNYDRPLIGTFELDGHTVLFHCWVGETRRLSGWTYARVTPDDLKPLDDFEDAEQIRAWADEFLTRQPAMVTLCVDEEIVGWRDVEADESAAGAIDALLDWYNSFLDERQKIATTEAPLLIAR